MNAFPFSDEHCDHCPTLGDDDDVPLAGVNQNNNRNEACCCVAGARWVHHRRADASVRVAKMARLPKYSTKSDRDVKLACMRFDMYAVAQRISRSRKLWPWKEGKRGVPRVILPHCVRCFVAMLAEQEMVANEDTDEDEPDGGAVEHDKPVLEPPSAKRPRRRV